MMISEDASVSPGEIACIAAVLDALEEAAALLDAHGRAVHVTSRLRIILGEEMLLAGVLRSAAESIPALCEQQEQTSVVLSYVSPRREGRSPERLRVRVHRLDPGTGTRLVLVQLQESIADTDDVRAHFGFTLREARVAIMLAERRTNAEVAGELGISIHTARHHIENVLAKMGVHSRRNVKQLLLSGDRR